MGKINVGRVVLGGLVAGVIINIVEGVMNGMILQEQWAAAAKAIGRSSVISPKQAIAFNLWGFALGIMALWVYASMRPRFGAGPKTAMLAGATTWILGYAMGNAIMAILHVFPLGLLLTVTAVGLVEILVATVAGAYLYKESSAGGQAMAARA